MNILFILFRERKKEEREREREEREKVYIFEERDLVFEKIKETNLYTDYFIYRSVYTSIHLYLWVLPPIYHTAPWLLSRKLLPKALLWQRRR